MKPKKPLNELKLPDSFEPPDVEDGEEFDAVVTIRKKGDSWCAVKIDGEDMPGYKGDSSDSRGEQEDTETDSDDYKPSMAKATKRALKY